MGRRAAQQARDVRAAGGETRDGARAVRCGPACRVCLCVRRETALAARPAVGPPRSSTQRREGREGVVLDNTTRY